MLGSSVAATMTLPWVPAATLEEICSKKPHPPSKSRQGTDMRNLTALNLQPVLALRETPKALSPDLHCEAAD